MICHCSLIIRSTLAALLKAWLLASRIRSTSRKILHILSSNRKERRSLLTNSVFDAWSSRDMSAMWRCARLLAITPVGAKRRRYDAPAHSSFDIDECTVKLAADGNKGGMECRHVASFPPCSADNIVDVLPNDDLLEESRRCVDPLLFPDAIDGLPFLVLFATSIVPAYQMMMMQFGMLVEGYSLK